jgi:hypothetical protein
MVASILLHIFPPAVIGLEIENCQMLTYFGLKHEYVNVYLLSALLFKEQHFKTIRAVLFTTTLSLQV